MASFRYVNPRLAACRGYCRTVTDRKLFWLLLHTLVRNFLLMIYLFLWWSCWVRYLLYFRQSWGTTRTSVLMPHIIMLVFWTRVSIMELTLTTGARCDRVWNPGSSDSKTSILLLSYPQVLTSDLWWGVTKISAANQISYMWTVAIDPVIECTTQKGLVMSFTS